MRKIIKYGLLIFGVVTIAIFGLIGYGLYTMEIEDHYGDLQEMFYTSKNRDIIINEKTYEFGIIEKNWTRVNIRTNEKDSTDLYNLIYKNGVEVKSKIYRPKKGEFKLNKIKYLEIKRLIDKAELKLISEN